MGRSSQLVSFPYGPPTTITPITLDAGIAAGKWIASTRGNYQDEGLGTEYDLSTTLLEPDLSGTYVDSLGWSPYNSGGETFIRFWNSTPVSGTWPTCTYNVGITEGLSYVQYVWCRFNGHSTGLQLAKTSTVTSVPDYNDGTLLISLNATGDLRIGEWDNGGAGGAGKISGAGNFSLSAATTLVADLQIDVDDVNLPFCLYRY